MNNVAMILCAPFDWSFYFGNPAVTRRHNPATVYMRHTIMALFPAFAEVECDKVDDSTKGDRLFMVYILQY